MARASALAMLIAAPGAARLSPMLARFISALMVALALISAYLQLNDPDPERWTAIYLSCAVVALLGALGRPSRGLSLLVGAISLVWALAIVPELIGRWSPNQLTATMTTDHPEIEFGRECAGLLIVFGFCLFTFLWARARERAGARERVNPPAA